MTLDSNRRLFIGLNERMDHLRKFAAEFIAAFFWVFAAVSALIADQHLAVVLVRNSIGLIGVAFATGLSVAVAIAAVGRISGAYANPAVTVALFVARRISGKDFAGFLAAQFAGGILAAFLAKALLPAAAVAQVLAGVPGLGEQVSVPKAVGIEAVLTFFLVLVIWGVAVDRRGPKSLAPMAVGLTVAAATLIGAAFTGAAMNPARWLGPALVSGKLANAAVWLAGPVFGALLASLLYEMVFLQDQPDEEEMASAAAAVSEMEAEAPGAPVVSSASETEAPVERPEVKPPPPPPPAAPTPPAPAAEGAAPGAPSAPAPETLASPAPAPPPPAPQAASPPPPITPPPPPAPSQGGADKAPEQ